MRTKCQNHELNMTRVSEKALIVALVCIVLLGSASAAEQASQFGSLHSGPSHYPPHYEHPPPKRPPTQHLSSPFGSFRSGPYQGPPHYEHPPPPL